MDLVAVNFVSWMAIITGVILMALTRSWIFDNAVFREATFQDINWVVEFIL